MSPKTMHQHEQQNLLDPSEAKQASATADQLQENDKLFSWRISVGPKTIFPAFDPSNRHFQDADYDMDIEYNHDIAMRDGIKLRADIFKPLNTTSSAMPIVLAITPYGKQNPFDVSQIPVSREFNPGFDGINCSKYTVFEGSDPAFWTKHGFAYVALDSRGSYASEGEKATLGTRADALDAYDAIEFLASRPWSNGHVGMIGASALGIIQWQAAALQPPHLSAIMVQDGFTCLYREIAWKGGVLHPNFMQLLNDMYIAHGNREGTPVVDFGKGAVDNPYMNDFWRQWQPKLEDITCAVYAICSLADKGLHTPGTIRGYLKVPSKVKYLELHPYLKWEWQLTAESLERQLAFFNLTLHGPDRQLSESVRFWPPVRLHVTEKHYAGSWRSELEFPLKRTVRTKYFLNADQQMSLSASSTSGTGGNSVSYTANSGSASWQITFATPTEITGTSLLHLNFATSAKGNDADADVFVTLQKLDRDGNVVYFPYHTFINDGHVAWGWLRASKRKLAPKSSIAGDEIDHTYLESDADFLQSGVSVDLDVDVQPSATLFRKGETLKLVVQGRDFGEYGPHCQIPRAGAGINGDEEHTIFIGKSFLEIPVIP